MLYYSAVIFGFQSFVYCSPDRTEYTASLASGPQPTKQKLNRISSYSVKEHVKKARKIVYMYVPMALLALTITSTYPLPSEVHALLNSKKTLIFLKLL